MTTTPPSPIPATTTPQPSPVSPPRALPASAAQSHYNSAYIEVENFIYNPTLVTGCLHRPASNEESVAVTEVLYGPHHLLVEDRHQILFFELRHHLSPNKPTTTT